jgi:hypothetical protein
MKTLSLGLALVAASTSLIACMGSPDVEDPENDDFLTPEAKADAFGVEDWSPDGKAVLALASTATQSKLTNDVGLSAQVAKSIIKQRGTLADKTFTNLADLDKAPYVGKTVFAQMQRYVTEHHLFKTALRIPLIVEDGDTKKPITDYNTAARAAGLTGFARYTFVDVDTKYSEYASTYNMRLQELAGKAHITIGGEVMVYAYSLAEYDVGSLKVCFVGDPKQVADVAAGQADDLVGDMYTLYGWRYKTTKFVEDQVENADEELGTDWTSYKTTSNNVLIMYTNDDDGSHMSADVVGPCR